MNILIVEDDTSIATFLQLLLEMDNHQVVSTRNAQLALELLDQFHPDLLIADFSLPGELTGADICVKARGRSADMASIIITGIPLGDIHDSCEEARPLAVLEKPIDYERLSRIIDGLEAGTAATSLR